MEAPKPKLSKMRLALTIAGWAVGLLLAVLGVRSCMRSTGITHPEARLGTTVEVGGVEFAPLDVGLREESGRTVMVLHARVKNITDGQVFNPLEQYAAASVRDNFGNPMPTEYPTGSQTLKPGESTSVTWTCAPPVVDNATRFTWSVRLCVSNESFSYGYVDVLFGASDIAPQQPRPPGHDPHEEKQPEQQGKVRLGTAVEIGGVGFTPLDIVLREESGQTVMVLRARVKNITVGQVFAPQGTYPNSTVTDNFRNVMHQTHDQHEAVGELKPGESVSATWSCEPPVVKNATEFTWSVRLCVSNESFSQEYVHVLFGASDIQPQQREGPGQIKDEEK